jgi:hypothetical protein
MLEAQLAQQLERRPPHRCAAIGREGQQTMGQRPVPVSLDRVEDPGPRMTAGNQEIARDDARFQPTPSVRRNRRRRAVHATRRKAPFPYVTSLILAQRCPVAQRDQVSASRHECAPAEDQVAASCLQGVTVARRTAARDRPDPDVSTSTPVRTADVAAGVARSDEHLDDVDGAGNDGARHPQQRGPRPADLDAPDRQSILPTTSRSNTMPGLFGHANQHPGRPKNDQQTGSESRHDTPLAMLRRGP